MSLLLLFSGGQQPDDDRPLAIDTIALHERMLERIRALEEALAAISRPGIGHNNPPEPLEDEPLTGADHQALAEALAVLESQPAQLNETPAEAIEAAKLLDLSARKSSPILRERAICSLRRPSKQPAAKPANGPRV